MTNPTRPRSSRHASAFTLLELLAVVAIIVILLALLVPALDKATKSAEKTQCLAHQCNVAKGFFNYGMASRGMLPAVHIGPYNMGVSPPLPPLPPLPPVLPGVLPPLPPIVVAPNPLTGNPFQYSMDLAASNYPNIPLGVGILVTGGFLPKTRLSEEVHCPTLDTSSSPVPNFGMDMEHDVGVGASGFDNPNVTLPAIAARIVSSYIYRGVSHARVRGGGTLRINQIGSAFALYADMIDPQYGIRFHHLDGYNRAMGDGSGALFRDEQYRVETRIEQIYNGTPQPLDGITAAAIDEAVFEMLSR